MKLSNRNTNIAGFILMGFGIMYSFFIIFALKTEPNFKVLATIFIISLLFFSIKNPKIQEMLVKILEKLPIKFK